MMRHLQRRRSKSEDWTMRMEWKMTLMLGLLLGACKQAPEPITGHALVPQNLPTRNGVLVGPTGTQIPLVLEVADDEAEREKGLMYRTELPSGRAMMFVWPEPRNVSFWMKNTLIPLDMIFIQAGKVVGLVSWAKPQDLTPLGVDAPADTVLEVPGGWANQHDVGVGWHLRVAQ